MITIARAGWDRIQAASSLFRRRSLFLVHISYTHNSLRPEVSSLEGTYTLFDLSTAYILS